LSQFPEEARLLVEQQLRLLSSCAKGLSPAQDTFTYEDPDTPEGAHQVADMDAARSDASLVEARQTIVGLLRETMSYWSANPELSDVRTIPSAVKSFLILSACFPGHKRPYTFYHFASLRDYTHIAPAGSSIGACVLGGRSSAHGRLAYSRLALGGTTRTSVIYFAKDRTRRRHKTAGGSSRPEYCYFVDPCAASTWRDGRGVPQ
jgi:hypothetical protein